MFNKEITVEAVNSLLEDLTLFRAFLLNQDKDSVDGDFNQIRNRYRFNWVASFLRSRFQQPGFRVYEGDWHYPDEGMEYIKSRTPTWVFYFLSISNIDKTLSRQAISAKRAIKILDVVEKLITEAPKEPSTTTISRS